MNKIGHILTEMDKIGQNTTELDSIGQDWIKLGIISDIRSKLDFPIGKIGVSLNSFQVLPPENLQMHVYLLRIILDPNKIHIVHQK